MRNSSILLFFHPLIHPFIRSFFHSSIHPLILPFIRSFFHSSIHPLIYPFIQNDKGERVTASLQCYRPNLLYNILPIYSSIQPCIYPGWLRRRRRYCVTTRWPIRSSPSPASTSRLNPLSGKIMLFYNQFLIYRLSKKHIKWISSRHCRIPTEINCLSLFYGINL